jgi:hypothetical protein
VDVTTYDFATQSINTSLLHAQLNQDDHADQGLRIKILL